MQVYGVQLFMALILILRPVLINWSCAIPIGACQSLALACREPRDMLLRSFPQRAFAFIDSPSDQVEHHNRQPKVGMPLTVVV
jgi:hypothetical protein